jgi:hypothetical protein
VNRIVQKIGGKCHVISTLGLGSIFTIHTQYPVSLAASTSSEASNAILTTAAQATENMDVAATDMGQKNIGIIENDLSLQSAYEQYFTKAGYVVHLIPYEEDAFNQYLAELPNCISS